MNLIIAKGLLIPFLGTALGSALVFFMKKELDVKIQKMLTGFAAGVVEKEQKKWTEGWATHALLWRSKLKLWGGEKILWGIYSVEKGEWLTDYSVDGNENVFFEDQVQEKAPYASPNFGIFVCLMVVKDGKRYFTVQL